MTEQHKIRTKTDRALSKLLPPLETPDIFKKVLKGKSVRKARPQHAPVSSSRTVRQSTVSAEPSDPLLIAVRHTVNHYDRSSCRKQPRAERTQRSQRPQRPQRNRNFRKSSVYKKGTGLTPTAKAVGLVTHAKEAFIKIDKASNGIKTSKHLMEAACYIARNGKNEIYDSFGEPIDFVDMKAKVEEWSAGDSPLADEEPSKYAEARRLILSCPKGSDPSLVLDSAKQFANEMLAANGYDFIMALHCKDEEHPNEPEHPHVHILLKSRNDDGIRFNPRKDDLKFMRERFAAIAKDHGLNINATPRAVRGVSTKAKPIERYHHERRVREKEMVAQGTQSQAQKWAIDRKKKQSVANHPYRTSRDREVINAVRTGSQISEHDALKKAKMTRQEIVKNAAHAISELNKIDDRASQILSKRLNESINELPEVKSAQQHRVEEIRAFIAEKQRRRQEQKTAGKGNQEQGKDNSVSSIKKGQSQAQRWAIDRKKRNLDR